jgi:hypothetical protein
LYADFQAHTDSWIRYDFIADQSCLTAFEHEDIETMKRQIAQWDAPLTKEFIWYLGDRANDSLIASRKRKREQDTAAEDEPRATKVAALSHSVISSYGAYHAPSPPPLADLISGLPPLHTANDSRPLSQEPVFDITQSDDIPQRSRSQEAAYLGDFRSNFDLAFATWLDEENISKAAIGRLLKDPALAPLTQHLSWASEKQMKEMVGRLDSSRSV